MCQEIQVGNFLASQDDKGTWIYKAKEQGVLLKKIHPKYREKPQFSLQNEIEGEAKNNFKKLLSNSVIAVIKLIK